MQKSKKSRPYSRKKQKSERVTGDALLYFCLHNLISVMFFFFFTVSFKVYEGKDIIISYVFTLDFWEMVIFQVLLFSIISSAIGRISAFLIMKAYFKYRAKKTTKTTKTTKTMKRWSELNRGINRFVLSIFLLTAFITSLLYSLGLVAILQDRIFNETSLLSLILTYILFKTGLFFLIRWVVRSKT